MADLVLIGVLIAVSGLVLAVVFTGLVWFLGTITASVMRWVANRFERD